MKVVVVESPAKAKTINKYLGSDYTVLASFGHVRDLPPKDGSVRPDEDFAMTWDSEGRGAKQIKELAAAAAKAVMLLLLLASLWCWAIIFDKGIRLARLRRRATVFERAFWSGAPLDDLYRRLAKRLDHPMAMMFAAAMEEWREAPASTEP